MLCRPLEVINKTDSAIPGGNPRVMFGTPPSHPLDAVLGVDFGLEGGDSDGDEPSQAVEAHCEALTVLISL